MLINNDLNILSDIFFKSDVFFFNLCVINHLNQTLCLFFAVLLKLLVNAMLILNNTI